MTPPVTAPDENDRNSPSDQSNPSDRSDQSDQSAGQRMQTRAIVVNSLVTAAIAGAVCWWALRGVDTSELGAALDRADPVVMVALSAAATAAFFAADITGFVLVYRRHLAPGVPVRDVAALVCAKQLPGLVTPILTKAVAPLYFRRRWGVPVLRTVGASEIITFADAFVVLCLVTSAFAFGALDLPTAVLVFVAVWWIYAALYSTWAWLPAARRILPGLREREFFRAFATARPREIAVQIGLRAGLAAVNAAVMWLMLAELGLRLDAGQTLVFTSIFLFATQLPVSVGGYGGPQGVTPLLLVSTWHLTDREQAAAFSLIWSTLLLAGRALAGVAFALPAVRLLRAPASAPALTEPSHPTPAPQT